MTHIFLTVLWLALPVAWGGTPRLFEQKEFTAAGLAEAVNHFIALGEKAAVKELLGLESDFITECSRDFRVNERIGWVCRILFQPKTEPIRPPGYGALDLPDSMVRDSKNWPLFPIALSGSTYFVLSEGYSLEGKAERPRDYIDHCQRVGVFRTKPIPVPTKQRAMADAKTLRESAVWKTIRWQDCWSDWVAKSGEKRSLEFIRQQAEKVR
jgi:hypothetical protein